MIKELILATSNAGKIAELQALLSPIHCTPQAELSISDADETGLSFIENALIKARHAAQESGKPALADDSGLCVNALNGAPGIYSARFAGIGATNDENIAQLLDQLADIENEQREAYFYCAIAVVKHAKDPTPIIAVGQLSGRITTSRIGDGGFGYDPIFYLPDYDCTVAQLPKEIKNQISHRARALQSLKQHLLTL